VIASSQDIFGDVEIRWLQQAMGKDFAQSLQKRLLIYKEFVSPQAFSEAQERMKILK
jgi:hypothetical protein